jgi:hypothetical protein
MAMKRLHSHQLGRVDLVPRALVRRSVAQFIHDLGIEFDRASDDLDSYHAAWFRLGTLTFGFMHHDGEPVEMTAIYLERALATDEAHKAIERILRKFDIPARDLAWEETGNLQDMTA